MNSEYFKALTVALDNAEVSTPTLVLDKDRLDRNIDHLIDVLNKGFDYRLVTKSLPSIPLLQYIMRRTGSQRLMCFHLPFLLQVVNQIPSADILMGKPMPIRAVKHFYDWHNAQTSSMCFSPELQLQWLVDSPKRLTQYENFAKDRGLTLRISLEIDVGMHRGGFRSSASFIEALQFISRSNYLNLTSLMGYEAHITHIPNILGGSDRAFADTRGRYMNFIAAVEHELGKEALKNLTLNTGGSTTYTMYGDTSYVSEIAAGAALVKPTNFDHSNLDHHVPAAFIAAPVLKTVDRPEIPLSPFISTLLRWSGVLPKKGAFIYGGNWLADPCYPEGTHQVKLHGRSSNQELYGFPADTKIKEDDFIFLRPKQSESVFEQFGFIAVYDDGEITDWWAVFQEQQQVGNATQASALDGAEIRPYRLA
jgi:D-serine deaminase-like pyridoxal phosphate-dependent protein